MGFYKIDKYKSLIKTRYHGQKPVTTANIIHNVCEEPVLLSCVREELKLCLLTALLKPAVFTQEEHFLQGQNKRNEETEYKEEVTHWGIQAKEEFTLKIFVVLLMHPFWSILK